MSTILKTENINKFFHDPIEFQVLKNIEFEVKKGEFLSMIGKSGSGKSTLLYILSTMDTDYTGNLFIDNQLTTGLSKDQLAELRNEKIGFVFQFHYLLSEFSCLKNVMIPALKLGKLSEKEIEENAYQKLEILGLQDQALKPASKLSGGQQQRVAIARALINDPLLIMGDEPTGNLDSKNTGIVFDIFQELTHNYGQTIIAVTHDEDFAKKSDRIIEMKDGEILKGIHYR
jgi:lipoprotein-releasing system ATP-binding protein